MTTKATFKHPAKIYNELYLFVRNVPESDLAIERARDEELVIPGMELDGGDKLNVLEDAEALQPADVPQSHRLVHAARQDEEVLGPGHV